MEEDMKEDREEGMKKDIVEDMKKDMEEDTKKDLEDDLRRTEAKKTEDRSGIDKRHNGCSRREQTVICLNKTCEEYSSIVDFSTSTGTQDIVNGSGETSDTIARRSSKDNTNREPSGMLARRSSKENASGETSGILARRSSKENGNGDDSGMLARRSSKENGSKETSGMLARRASKEDLGCSGDIVSTNSSTIIGCGDSVRAKSTKCSHRSLLLLQNLQDNENIVR